MTTCHTHDASAARGARKRFQREANRDTAVAGRYQSKTKTFKALVRSMRKQWSGQILYEEIVNDRRGKPYRATFMFLVHDAEHHDQLSVRRVRFFHHDPARILRADDQIWISHHAIERLTAHLATRKWTDVAARLTDAVSLSLITLLDHEDHRGEVALFDEHGGMFGAVSTDEGIVVRTYLGNLRDDHRPRRGTLVLRAGDHIAKTLEKIDGQ